MNCGAGLSRSTAAGLILLDEWALSSKMVVERVFTVSELATSNIIMLELYRQEELYFLANQRIEVTLQKYFS
ncbi:hypothetical protein [Trichormus azollae]|uniref:hypothetical protein n=1 Tax=Trichormus azollae TaxID=1164 RepID=UPI00325E6091